MVARFCWISTRLEPNFRGKVRHADGPTDPAKAAICTCSEIRSPLSASLQEFAWIKSPCYWGTKKHKGHRKALCTWGERVTALQQQLTSTVRQSWPNFAGTKEKGRSSRKKKRFALRAAHRSPPRRWGRRTHRRLFGELILSFKYRALFSANCNRLE